MLYLDLETYSDIDIKKVSTDKYASHPSTRILMCAYAGDTGPVELWEESDGPEPLAKLLERMASETCVAWHVDFERSVTGHKWRRKFKWLDTMVYSLYAGMPAGLKDCNKLEVFKNQAETSKESLLINKFCKPQKTGVPRNKETDPEDWARFCQYCKDDVHDARMIHQWIEARFDWPERERLAWEIDQRINMRGVPIDRLLTYRAWEEAQRLQEAGMAELKELTGLENPNSPVQLLGWLRARGYPYTGLSKELVLRALNEDPNAEADFDDD